MGSNSWRTEIDTKVSTPMANRTVLATTYGRTVQNILVSSRTACATVWAYWSDKETYIEVLVVDMLGA